MSDPSTQDPRVRRTRRLLQEAVLSLVEEKGFGSITVRDITRRADVNRATFYLHYRDKAELAADALDALFDEVAEEDRAFVASQEPLRPDVIPPPLVTLFRHLAKRQVLYRRLFADSASSSFADRLQLFEQSNFRRIWAAMGLVPVPGGAPMELRASMATSMVRGTIVWWVESEHAESAETVAGWLWEALKPLWFTQILAQNG